jgi:hypothetical protein
MFYFNIVEGCSPQDELLMKAKINFSCTQVGHHINVLNFEGAVVSDSESMNVNPSTVFKKTVVIW